VLLKEFSAIATDYKKQNKILMCMVPQTEYIPYFNGVQKCLWVLPETHTIAFNLGLSAAS
jgi:hypothetical protein